MEKTLKAYNIKNLDLTKYIFYTGKGGVGKTSTACATAVALADLGKKVMLVSTDPASNLQDVFDTELNNKGTEIQGVSGLFVANFDPEAAALEYKENVVGPFRGKLPESVIKNMEEQLSGSCTVEIAAFNEFTAFVTDKEVSDLYDHIIFDTAPTGHTLRMLQLPSAWSSFVEENTTGASCLGQLSGLNEKKDVYKSAVKKLTDKALTTLILVTRPELSPLEEAGRASKELQDIGIVNQLLVINGLLMHHDDSLSEALYKKQTQALEQMPDALRTLDTLRIPLRAYNIIGLNNIRGFLNNTEIRSESDARISSDLKGLSTIIDDLHLNNKRIIFTMGKGGVGKTTIACAIAKGLVKKGKKVHLATTDPAAGVESLISETENLSISRIDEKVELENYKRLVLDKVEETLSKDDYDYIMEDLKSPCTQEIAVFRAFADLVNRSEDEIVVIDTAPTGHTLLLLDATQSYHKEIERAHGDIPESVIKLLPKLRDESMTEVVVVTLAETTPVYEALRLKEDLSRAGIASNWWSINSSFYCANTKNEILKARAKEEIKWINKINEISAGKFAVIEWFADDIKHEKLDQLIN